MKHILFALATLAWFLAPSHGHAADELVFGLIGTERHETLLKSFAPLSEALARCLGIPVRVTVHQDYAGAIWDMRSGRTHFAWMGNKAALEAVDSAGAEVGLMALSRNDGAGYFSHLIVRKDSGLISPQDVLARAADLTLALGDPNSTSGSLVPGYYLFATRNLDPETLFKRTIRAQHEENFLAVAQGRADVAATNSVDLQRFKSRYPSEWAGIRIIWTSPRIPSDPIVWKSSLPDPLKKAIRECFISFGKPAPGKGRAELQAEADTLADLQWTGFVPSDNSQLAPVRRIELYRRMRTLEADDTMPADVRTARIKAIDEALLLLGAPEDVPAP
ncbi:hypothetical protein NNJEOMEG_01962 [Fundidesulfovibrio magnetotacticus]|uniref:Phosphonate ABC transporter substrate-binding protein n=1 Tax=Fundidesulfovibrio magnetotacticus TaxID=2730080 RepID=A0A6V8LNA9_9BACT|nr:phosphate/phosphite/phosphonate ABC transporter substrate-binding protein [Fundidesulfovibrio magnetotacticus]GFK94123.1 hypothetical protein NNJEOMEG_01962 [Fundidesulfovibrio magnetotacticus]